METNMKNLSKKETTRTPHVADLVEKFDEARISNDSSSSRQPKNTTALESRKGLESGLGPTSTTTTTTKTTTTVGEPASTMTVREPATLGNFPISGVVEETGSSFAAPSYEYKATPMVPSSSSAFDSSFKSTGSSYESRAHKAPSGSSYEAAPSASTSYDSSHKSGTTNKSYASGDIKQSGSATDRANLQATEREAAAIARERAAVKFDHAKTELKEGAAQTAVAAKDVAAGVAIQAKEKIGEAGEAVRDNAMWAAERAEVKWEQTKEVTSEAAATMGDKLSTAATVVKEDVIYAKHYVAETAVAISENLSHKAEYAKEVVIGAKNAVAHGTAENLRWAADKIDPLPNEQSEYVHTVDKSDVTTQPGGLASSTSAQTTSPHEREYSEFQ